MKIATWNVNAIRARHDRLLAFPGRESPDVVCLQELKVADVDFPIEAIQDDYRMLAFPKGNGLRIDHLFVTDPVAKRCRRAWVDRNERKGKLPSDHAPVLIELSD